MICTQIAGIDPQYKHLSAISGLSEVGLDSVQSLNIQMPHTMPSLNTGV